MLLFINSIYKIFKYLILTKKIFNCLYIFMVINLNNIHINLNYLYYLNFYALLLI